MTPDFSKLLTSGEAAGWWIGPEHGESRRIHPTATTRSLEKGKVGRTAEVAAPHVYGPPVVVEVKVTIKALAFHEADGGYSVVVPELPGCVTEGDTLEEAREMAAAGWLAVMHDHHREECTRNATEPLPGESGA